MLLMLRAQEISCAHFTSIWHFLLFYGFTARLGKQLKIEFQ